MYTKINKNRSTYVYKISQHDERYYWVEMRRMSAFAISFTLLI